MKEYDEEFYDQLISGHRSGLEAMVVGPRDSAGSVRLVVAPAALLRRHVARGTELCTGPRPRPRARDGRCRAAGPERRRVVCARQGRGLAGYLERERAATEIGPKISTRAVLARLAGKRKVTRPRSRPCSTCPAAKAVYEREWRKRGQEGRFDAHPRQGRGLAGYLEREGKAPPQIRDRRRLQARAFLVRFAGEIKQPGRVDA